MQAEETSRNANTAKTLADTGTGFDPKRLAALSYGPQWERQALSLPVYGYHRGPLQNPDGSFRFMAEIDPVDGGAPVG